MIVLSWVALGGVCAVATRLVMRRLAVDGPLRRLNYRGLGVPTAAGIAIVVAYLVPVVLLRLVEIVHTTAWTRRASDTAGVFAYVMAAFALLGLWDDLAGSETERGWRAHLRALASGRPSAGAIKIVGGVCLGLIALSSETELEWALVGAPMIALCANAFNLLDLRPGRASKVFLLACVPLLVPVGHVAPAIAIAVGGVGAFLPFDLRERAMLGDTGAFALGAFVGWGVIERGSHAAWVVVLLVLVVVHAVADRPGLSRLIDAVPPFRAFDRAGRVPE